MARGCHSNHARGEEHVGAVLTEEQARFALGSDQQAPGTVR